MCAGMFASRGLYLKFSSSCLKQDELNLRYRPDRNIHLGQVGEYGMSSLITLLSFTLRVEWVFEHIFSVCRLHADVLGAVVATN